MPFKLVKCWSGRSGKSVFAGVMILAALAAFPHFAEATVTITPQSPWVSVNNNVYYLHETTASSLMWTGFKSFNFSTASSSEVSGSRSNIVYFDVSSDKTFSNIASGSSLVVMVYASVSSGSVTSYPVPLVYGGSADCSSSGNCNQLTDSGVTNYFTVDYSSGSAVRVGFYLEDICSSIYSRSPTTVVSGCSNGHYVTPISGDPTQFNLNFYVSVAAEGALGNITDTQQYDSQTFGINTQSAGPVIPTCPSLTDVYFPSDSEILLEPTNFVNSVQSVAGNAALTNLVVVGKKGADPIVTSSYASGNDIFSTLALGQGAQAVTGFTNTTNGSDNTYNLFFSVQDYTGALSAFSCPLRGVQTSAIQGFLSRSNCFIATAAFRSPDDDTVMMLRTFRDSVLKRSFLGRKFISWYYSWSPRAAEWLMLNPQWRFPVLTALVPVEIGAWLLLHPMVAMVLIFGAIGTLVLGLGLRPRRFPLVLLLTGLVLSSITVFASEETSSQPYIDRLREGLEKLAEQSPEQNGELEPYLKEKKKKLDLELGEKKDPSGYSEYLRSTDPEAGKVESPESYIEKRKAQLPPVAEGSGLEIKDLQLKRPGAIHHAVAVKIGASMTRNIQSSAAYRSFADVYGSGWNPNVLLTYEFQPFHSEWFGNVGFVLGTGVAYQGGQGAFQYNLENPAAPGTYFGSSSRTKFQFFAVPLLAGVNYRFNLLRVLRPYVQFTPTLIGYKEARSDGQTGNRGYSKGFYANGGVNILLDWMDRKATWSLYETQGVKHYYLTVDYSQLTTFASEVSFNVSGVSAGLTYEF